MAFWKGAGMDQKVSPCEMQLEFFFFKFSFPFFMLAGKSDYVSSQNLCEEKGWLGGNKTLHLLLQLLPGEALQDTGNSL